MNKIIILLLIAGLLLAGCTTPLTPSGSNPSDTPPNSADIPQPPATPTDADGDSPPTLPF